MPKANIPQRRPRRKHRIWPWVLLVLCFVAAAIGGALFASSSLLDRPTEQQAAEEGLLTASDKATIMIMGVDERDDDVGRSDTLMVASIDPKKNQASLLSVPRDTRVKIKGHGFDKINAAYAYGHEQLSQDTVENLLGLNIDHYIIINTKSFKKIIDAIGGIDIDVPKRMYYEDPWDDDGGLIIDFKPGKQHMDGAKAITYVRYRDEEGDIGRIHRQQAFVQACLEKLVSPAIIPKLPTVIREVMSSIKTDLSFKQLLEFAGTLKEAKSNGLKTDMVPGRPLYIDGISYWIPDLNKLRVTVANTLGISLNSRYRAKLEADVQEYERSIPADATAVPASDTSIGHSTSKDSDRSEKSTSATKKKSELKDPDKISSRSTSRSESDNTTSDDSRSSDDNSQPTTTTARTATSEDSEAPTHSSTAGKTR